jgi:hypothetical protein
MVALQECASVYACIMTARAHADHVLMQHQCQHASTYDDNEFENYCLATGTSNDGGD